MRGGPTEIMHVRPHGTHCKFWTRKLFLFLRIITITIKTRELILKWSKTKHKTGLYAVVYLITKINI